MLLIAIFFMSIVFKQSQLHIEVPGAQGTMVSCQIIFWLIRIK